MTALALAVDRVEMRFQGLVALSDVTMNVPPREIHGLIGPNGAGKTTLFNCLSGFYAPTAGKITVGGSRAEGLAPHQISSLGVSRTFQNIRLFGAMTALENVLIGGHAHQAVGGKTGQAGGGRGPRSHPRATGRRSISIPGAVVSAVREIAGVTVRLSPVRAAESKAIQQARAVLDWVGLGGRANEIARNLPYGDQRRLELARALAARPGLLLLDEPTAGMNPNESLAMVSLIRRIRDEFDTTIVLIEHQMRVVMGVCEQITVLDYGVKIAEGTPETVQKDARVIEAYLGTKAIGGASSAPA